MQVRNRLLAAALVLFSLIPASALSADAPVHHTASSDFWVALGVGFAPSPYGTDRNGSPLGDLGIGRRLHHRITMVSTLTRYEFGGRTVTKFTQVAIGLRAHLSPEHAKLGGPYLGVAPALCHARFRDSSGTSDRWLPGVEAAVGTVIPFTDTFAIDWSASHVITPDAGGLSPDPVTHSTRRDGLDRGAMRIRLVLMR